MSKSKMSKFSHDDDDDADAADDDHARTMTIPQRFLRKQPSKNLNIGKPNLSDHPLQRGAKESIA